MSARSSLSLCLHLGYDPYAFVPHHSLHAPLRLHRRAGRARRPRSRAGRDLVVSVASFNYHLSAPYDQWSFTPPHFARASALLAAAFFLIFISWQQRPHRGPPPAPPSPRSSGRPTPLSRAEKLPPRHGPPRLHHRPQGSTTPLESVTNLLYLARNGESIDDTIRSYPRPRRGGSPVSPTSPVSPSPLVRTAAVRAPVDIAAVPSKQRPRHLPPPLRALADITVERHYTPQPPHRHLRARAPPGFSSPTSSP